jgi:DNA-binding MarR family transcriptional regulator
MLWQSLGCLKKGLASRVESQDDRRVRIVALTKNGKDVIFPMIFRAPRGNRVF